LQNLALGGLRIAKIHHLIHKFIDDHKVVPYTLLLELLEVFHQDLGQPVEEKDDFCSIGVSF
jgi:hypothetical protein